MSRSFRMQGGSAGSAAVADAGSHIGFFQPGVNSILASGKKNIRGRILPSRDTNLSPADTAYATSVMPYRDMTSGELDKETMTPAFNPWFAIIRAYRFFGRSEESFISPITLRPFVQNALDCACPVIDCFELAKKSDNNDWLRLVEKPAENSQERRSILYRPGALALMNMYCQEDGKQFENAVMVVTKTAMDNLKDKLSNPTVYGTEPVDPDFPRFLFGDITNPETGLVVHSAQIASADNKHIKYNGFVIGSRDKELQGVTRHPLPDREAILAKRWDLLSDSTLKILTYQEIVDLLILDGAIPYELIAQACGEMANLPGKAPARNTTVSSPANTHIPVGADRGAAQSGNFSAAYGVPSAMLIHPPTAAPAAPVDDLPMTHKYWVNSPAGVVLKSREDIQAIMNLAVGENPLLMKEDQSGGWVAADALGFAVKQAAPAAPAPPAAPAQPASAAPAPPAPPAPPAAPAPPVESKASAEDLAEHAALLTRLESTTDPLTGAEAARLVALSKLIKG